MLVKHKGIFKVKHKGIFKVNTDVHGINTRQKLDLHVPSTRLMRIQKGLYYPGITLFNVSPLEIKQAAHDIKKFKHILKAFLITNSFYSVEEYFNIK
jgi:hypothetical protein